jgi:hypothetical protein
MGLDIDFAFDVGIEETHHITFHWGQLLGRIRITVDGEEIVQHNQALSLRSETTRKFEFSVGQSEVHQVLIEKTRKRVLAGARKQICRAYVDGQFVGEY